jgi:hypothetical protein
MVEEQYRGFNQVFGSGEEYERIDVKEICDVEYIQFLQNADKNGEGVKLNSG